MNILSTPPHTKLVGMQSRSEQLLGSSLVAGPRNQSMLSQGMDRFVKTNVIGLLVLVFLLGVLPQPALAATFSQELDVIALPNGTIRLSFGCSQINSGTLSVDVYRRYASVPSATPTVSSFGPGDMIGSGFAITPDLLTALDNLPDDSSNQANGFYFGTQTNSEQGYFYLVTLKEAGVPDVNSRIRGAVADAVAPQVLTSGQFTQSVGDATSSVNLQFTNPGDSVLDPFYSETALKQIAIPAQQYYFRYRYFRLVGLSNAPSQLKKQPKRWTLSAWVINV